MKPDPLPPFQTLVDAHARPLAAFLGGMLGPDAAEDALQETLLAALRAYPRFDGANPRAWLFTIARRKAIDAARAARRRPEGLAEPDLLPGSPGADDGFPGDVWTEVAALPDKQRAAVVLRFAADLRYREIGAAIDCSEDAARRNVAEALAKLRKSTAIEGVRR